METKKLNRTTRKGKR